MKFSALYFFLLSICAAASVPAAEPLQASKKTTAVARPPFLWENATVYFLLTDRFNNANKANDFAYGRRADAAPLRGYLGGDLAGITAKIKQGYFKDLGVDVIWITPPVEQIHAGTDEGTGKSYAFHGYWARDFTQVDANLGTQADMLALVDTAHAHGIRVLLDVVMNHMGPVTDIDPVWPEAWVRTGPPCTFKDVETTVKCTLVKNLPDIRTDNNESVELPPPLVDKWKKEGRYQKQVKELDAFFARTGWPRAPRYYLMKWHADWVRKYGFDGFRADTVKHVEPGVWKELKQEASLAYEDWKKANPKKKLGDEKFFMTAEIYNYTISQGLETRMDGGSRVNFYDNGFDSLINFGFKSDANKNYEELFSSYSEKLNTEMKDHSVLNYISSHDDDHPFDVTRSRVFEAGTKLLLSPGAAQIYYGDETARELIVADAKGDAALRSLMNWDALAKNASRVGYSIAEVRRHWSKLGLFRRAHVAVGAGEHLKLSDSPYTFKRSYEKNGISDSVIVALDLPTEKDHTIAVHGVFADGQKLKDYYSGKNAIVVDGKVSFNGENSILLIGRE